jgi:hypothetical protein
MGLILRTLEPVLFESAKIRFSIIQGEKNFQKKNPAIADGIF